MVARSRQDDRLDARNGLIWRAYVQGATQETIAAEHGLSHRRVGQILAKIRASIPEADRAHLVMREVELLDQLRGEALALVDQPPAPAYSAGRPVHMPDGSIAEDHSARLAAIDRALKTHDRLVRLLGLDAAKGGTATVTLVSVRSETDRAPDELVQRIRAWKAGRAEGGQGQDRDDASAAKGD